MNDRLRQSFEDYEKMLLEAGAYSGNTEPGTKHFSASMLGDDLLQCFLKFKHGVPPAKKFEANTAGSIYQLGVDYAASKKQQQYDSGFRLYCTLPNGWIVSGEIDQLDRKYGVVYDNKLTNTTKIKSIKKDGKQDAYALQLGVYKWLLKRNGIKNDLDEDWISAIPAVDKKFSYFDPKTVSQLEFIPVETYDLDEIEAMLIEKTNQLQQFIDLDSEPGECKNLFLYRDKKGMTKRMRCLYYCDQSVNCKYWNKYLKTTNTSLTDKLGLT